MNLRMLYYEIEFGMGQTCECLPVLTFVEWLQKHARICYERNH